MLFPLFVMLTVLAFRDAKRYDSGYVPDEGSREWNKACSLMNVFGLLYGLPRPNEWHWHFLAQVTRVMGIGVLVMWLWLAYDAFYG